MNRTSYASDCSTESHTSSELEIPPTPISGNKVRGRDRMAELMSAGVQPLYGNKYIDVRTIKGSGLIAQSILSKISELDADLKKFPKKLKDLVAYQKKSNDHRVHEDVLEKHRYSLGKISQKLKNGLLQFKTEFDALDVKIQLLPKDNADYNMCSNQLMMLRRQFLNNLNELYRVESEYSSKQKRQLLKELRVVHPEATEADLQNMTGNLFRNDLLQAAGAEKEVLSIVRARHEEIIQIEKSVEEIAELFYEIHTLIAAQDFVVDYVYDQVGETIGNIDEASYQLDKAIKRRKAAIRLCWGIWIVIAIILLSLAIYFGVSNFGTANPNNPDAAPPSDTSAVPEISRSPTQKPPTAAARPAPLPMNSTRTPPPRQNVATKLDPPSPARTQGTSGPTASNPARPQVIRANEGNASANRGAVRAEANQPQAPLRTARLRPSPPSLVQNLPAPSVNENAASIRTPVLPPPSPSSATNEESGEEKESDSKEKSALPSVKEVEKNAEDSKTAEGSSKDEVSQKMDPPES